MAGRPHWRPLVAENPAQMRTSTALVGLGANLGQPQTALALAVAGIARLPETSVRAVSRLWISEPVDAEGPPFFNAVAQIDTALSPLELLAGLQSLEQAAGRERPFRHAPRTLDLDLLTYADECWDTPVLTLPHPRMHQRLFVLMPLLELLPDHLIPGRGIARDMAKSLMQTGAQSLQPAPESASSPWWQWKPDSLRSL